MSNYEQQQLVVVSNRLPVVIERDPDGEPRASPGSGGLVSALSPVLAATGGSWIGWAGCTDLVNARALLGDAERELGCRLEDVPLTADEVLNYYQGFANEVLWPLFHDQPDRCRFKPIYWQHYEEVNRKFARIVAERTTEDELVWVHDYHLIRVGAELRDAGVDRRLAFFLHIPFPAYDLFATLPQRDELLDGVLAYSLVGFQTERDLDNFVVCIERLREKAIVEGAGSRRTVRMLDGPTVILAVVPISVDYQGFVARAARPEVVEARAHIHAQMPGQQLILGLDRLDYSKGIPERLAAFDLALERHPELHGRVTLIQVVVPSRVEIPDYLALKSEIEGMVAAINGKYWEPGWTPLQYLYRSLDETELLAYYGASDVALVTSLKDGMNLISKEYCACRLEDDGVLILSEFAGAAAELGDESLLVNPHDVEQTADAIHQALTMGHQARTTRMRALRRLIRRADIFAWVDSFFELLPRPSSAPPHQRIIRPAQHEAVACE